MISYKTDKTSSTMRWSMWWRGNEGTFFEQNYWPFDVMISWKRSCKWNQSWESYQRAICAQKCMLFIALKIDYWSSGQAAYGLASNEDTHFLAGFSSSAVSSTVIFSQSSRTLKWYHTNLLINQHFPGRFISVLTAIKLQIIVFWQTICALNRKKNLNVF